MDHRGRSDGDRQQLLTNERPAIAADERRMTHRGMKTPDWSRFGLKGTDDDDVDGRTEDVEKATETYQQQTADSGQTNELFQQDSSARSKPWWSTNFFVSEPVLFNTWDGVFTSCLINIFGVIIFLRTGWMVGNAGIGLSILIIVMTIAVALVAALSAIGVCERCKMESGGVYFLLSHVLGARLGASIGILYCFGQAVSCSLYTIGFGESISSLLNRSDPWIARAVAIAVVVLLLGINVAGVKWVIRLQLALLFILFVAVLDFLVGSFVHTSGDIHNGFIGYDIEVLRNNTAPNYLPGESFFSVFGVFFPTATGVFAGINMSGDLQNPRRSIPLGTLSAVGVSTLLYLLFAVVLGATCLRHDLQTDYMIAEKVSFLGALFLIGLYISSISSCMGALYGSPRILQSIANENVIPAISILGQGRGPNKVPVYSLLTITAISLIFILIGKLNTLAPIVTMPFMITYAAVDYAYFALAMSFDSSKAKESPFLSGNSRPADTTASHGYGSVQTKKDDLDYLFPERQDGKNDLGSPTFVESSSNNEAIQSDCESNEVAEGEVRRPMVDIQLQPKSFYSALCNRWFSLIGGITSVVIMFGIQWGYALANFVVLTILYVYIGQANPCVFPGIADFSMYNWLKETFNKVFRRKSTPEQMVVNPHTPTMNTTAAQLTEDNEDFAERGRYHQSEVFKTNKFDDIDSDD